MEVSKRLFATQEPLIICFGFFGIKLHFLNSPSVMKMYFVVVTGEKSGKLALNSNAFDIIQRSHHKTGETSGFGTF